MRERNGEGTRIGRHWQRAAGAICVIALSVVVYLAFLQPGEPVRLSGIDVNGEQEADAEAPSLRHDRSGGGAPGLRYERPRGTSPSRSQYASSVEHILDSVNRPR